MLTLENRALRLTILPEVGAKIYDLVSLRTGRALLWHNPRIEPQPYPIDSIFDNYWCGGWDDCFPTCDGCRFQGAEYPDLGELRSLKWRVEECGAGHAVLSCYGPISPVRVVKTVRLDGDAPVLTLRHQITNIGPRPVEFIWGTHAALNAGPATRLVIPARTAQVAESSCAGFGAAGQIYAWPRLETPVGVRDMSLAAPPGTGDYCGHYAYDLEAGWYAVDDMEAGERFRLEFPLETCPTLWMWLNYGGYRGLHHVIVEPWTSRPVNLAEASHAGTSRSLAPGAMFDVEVRATVESLVEGVSR